MAATNVHTLCIEFEKQESLLAEKDFCALWRVLWDLKPEIVPLAFYNSGKESGAR